METDHAKKAAEHIQASTAIRYEIDDLVADSRAPDRSRRLDRAGSEMRLGLKLAQIHATLAVAQAFREWTALADEPIAPPADLIALPELHQLPELHDDERRICDPDPDPHQWPTPYPTPGKAEQ